MTSSDDSPPVSVHGRFQPFHNGHLNYVRSALECTRHLYIGVTQVHRRTMEHFSEAPHRSVLENNPLSFFERLTIVRAALVESGISEERFTVIPFPIEQLDELSEFFPTGGICYTTIHSEWNNKKIEMLHNAGYNVQVLEDPDRWNRKVIAATEIRRMIRAGDPRWTMFVPPSVARLIQSTFMSRFGPIAS